MKVELRNKIFTSNGLNIQSSAKSLLAQNAKNKLDLYVLTQLHQIRSENNSFRYS